MNASFSAEQFLFIDGADIFIQPTPTHTYQISRLCVKSRSYNSKSGNTYIIANDEFK